MSVRVIEYDAIIYWLYTLFQITIFHLKKSVFTITNINVNICKALLASVSNAMSKTMSASLHLLTSTTGSMSMSTPSVNVLTSTSVSTPTPTTLFSYNVNRAREELALECVNLCKEMIFGMDISPQVRVGGVPERRGSTSLLALLSPNLKITFSQFFLLCIFS